MKSCKKTNLILIIFFISLISCFLIYLPFTYIIGKPYQITNFGNDVVPRVHESGFFSEQLNKIEKEKAALENLSIHRFPFYSTILKSNSDFEQKLNSTFLSSAQEENQFTLTFTGDYNNYISQDKTYMLRTFSRTPSQIMDDIDESAELYNTVEEKYPELNVSLYFAQEPWSSDILKNTNIHVPDGQKYVDYFLSKLDKNINADYLPLTTLEDYKKNFYASDHHWNIYGAYQGYQDTVASLGKNYEEIGEPVAAKKFFSVPNVKFQGSIARQSLIYDVIDKIYDIDTDLGSYSCEVNSDPMPSYFSEKQRYLQGIFDDSAFINHYARYFHSDYANVKFTFDNDSGRNLLVFADSLTNCMDYLLASHYNNTYFIDFRSYKEVYGKDFDMDSFVSENDIDDILFFYMSDTALCEIHNLGKSLLK